MILCLPRPVYTLGSIVKVLSEITPIYRHRCQNIPFEDKIHSKDRLNYKTVYSVYNTEIGEVEVVFADSIIVRIESEGTSGKISNP
jgi:hypothetical protein